MTASFQRSDERITVLRIMDRLNIGGPAIHAVLTAKGLDPSVFRTVLVVGTVEPGEGDMGYLLEQHGVRDVVTIPTLGRELRPLRDLKTLWQLVQVIRRERPLVVHTHKAKAGALGRLAAVLCAVPVRVHTYHGHVLSGYFGPLKSRVFALLERGLALISSPLITPSAAVADDLADNHKVAKRDRFEVIPLGFDLEPFAQCAVYQGQLRAELGVDPQTKLVGIVGRLVPVKDHATFIAAAALVAATTPDVRFVLVGGGSDDQIEKIQQDLASRGLNARAHVLGWRKDLPRIYADLDVVVLSSINEGTPVSLIEAMACGVPVVSTDVGGVSDVLRGGAWGELVPARDPGALAAGIVRALAPPAKARAASVRTSVTAAYGIDRLCEDLKRLYLKQLGRE
jgi:glycosyltransferase involved in cell wall biosynthesis